ncbi:MAG: carboxylesterase family protein, partial [Ginsengibacter sp.]
MNKIVLTYIFSLLIVLSTSAQTGKLTAKTENGIVQGSLEKSGVISFKGIPFAAPPVGDLRWKEPQPAKNWTGTLKATKFQMKPMQTNIFGDMNSRAEAGSEDCLYLNVWAPSKKGKELLPVLVYFYGGGFVAGDASEPRYDGESMAQKGIVSITVNYRLGVFGFFAHPEISQETSYHGSGNYGLLDQAASLQWVQKNISAFGGDPKRVTIAGESAGSVSVSAQMASPISKNLFAGAIGESGSILGVLPAVSLKAGEQTGVEFAQTVGASSLADLRTLSADSLLSASTKFGVFRFARTIDNYFFTESPFETFSKGEQSHVPLLVGWNNEEMNHRMIMGADSLTKDNYIKAVKKIYPDNSEEVLKLYDPATDQDIEKVATDLASDRFIAFSTWKWADVQAKTGGKDVYRYLYERARPAMRPELGQVTAGLAGGVQKSND